MRCGGRPARAGLLVFWGIAKFGNNIINESIG